MNIYHVFMLLGGLALFLYGMKMMSDGLKLIADFRLKRLLSSVTNNRWIAAATGAIITTIIQSSTATTIMVLSFVNSGLMTLNGAFAIIIGANVGTTISSMLLTFDIKPWAPLFIFIGTIAMLFMKKKKINHMGMILLGFGVLFLGLGLMSDSMLPLRESPYTTDLFEYTRNPIIGVLIGFSITALIQSSTATIGIILSMISVGIINDINQAIFILYGLNLGGTVTALLATMGANKAAKQTAIANLIFNSFGVVIFIILLILKIDLATIVQLMSSHTEQQLVYAHIIFNAVITILLLPLAEYIAKIAEKMVKNDDEIETEFKFHYIDVRLLNNPSILLEQTTKEIARMMDIVLDNYQNCISILDNKNVDKVLEEICKNEELINYLNKKINKFLVNLNTIKLEKNELEIMTSCYKTIGSLERIGDLSKDIAYANKLYLQNANYSEKIISMLKELAKRIEDILILAFELFKDDQHNENKVNEIKILKEVVKDIIDSKEITGIDLVRISNDMNRISNHALSVAKTQRYKTEINIPNKIIKNEKASNKKLKVSTKKKKNQ